VKPAAAELEPGYQGRVAETVAESSPSWPARPTGARPNVLVVLLDDVGFAQLGCFGSSIRTPNIDALAADGLVYSNFHAPALCSPTRASLLTGRNHHAVGMGFLAAFDTGFPNYRGRISPAAATLPEMLRPAGYGSYAVGKWHLIPPAEMSASGPFDAWPTQRGFDRYYGYLWGEDDQFSPELWYDQHRVETPTREGYHVTDDFVDRMAEFIDDHRTNRPDDPFFGYLALGACHAPHQAPPEYLARSRGAFDHGWDAERERVLARQLELSLVPPGTTLSERNPGVRAWDELADDERRFAARLQEAFAGFMEHTDAQLGRLLDHLRSEGVLDDTVVILMSDNGASGEGGDHGTINEYRYFLGLDDSLEEGIAAIDLIGGPHAHNQYPAGWAQAGNTPFRMYKKHTHGGGVRVPFILRQAGVGTGVRDQFFHAIDVAPTILELAGVEAPTEHRGVAQLPIDGSSMRPSFASPDAAAPGRAQYFETVGFRGIHRDGWKAIADHTPGTPFAEDAWELYDVDRDRAESHDLAAQHPELLDELVEAWWEEARRNGVLPLDDRMGQRVAGLDPAHDRRRYRMRPGARFVIHVVGPSFSERPFSISAHVELDAHSEGVLLAYGRRAFGFSLFVQHGRLVFDYNLAGRHTVTESTTTIEPGTHTLAVVVAATPEGGSARLLVDGVDSGGFELPRAIPGGIGTLSVQCGHNEPSPVSPRYDPPYRFTGRLDEVVIELGDRIPGSLWREAEAELSAQ
jgi:arylsulfatase